MADSTTNVSTSIPTTSQAMPATIESSTDGTGTGSPAPQSQVQPMQDPNRATYQNSSGPTNNPLSIASQQSAINGSTNLQTSGLYTPAPGMSVYPASSPSPMTPYGQQGSTPSTPYNNMATNMAATPAINNQYKRPYEDAYAQSTKRPKMEGLQPMNAMGPPLAMGPPSAMGPPNSLQKKDQGLDEGDPNDVFGGAGINLQDEERNMTTFDVPTRNNGYGGQQAYMQQHQDRGDSARKSEFLHLQALDYFIGRKLSEAGLHRVDPVVLSLIAMATKDRLSGLLGQMIVLAKHRCAAPPKNGKPIDDVGRILKSISLAEAQDEERRRTIAAARRLEEETKRKEAEEAASMSTKRKVGAAKTLTEQALARNANATANMMLNQSGGKKYSWMTGAPNTSQLPRRNVVQAFNGIQPNVFKTGAEEHGNLITLKDFISAIELEGEDIVGRGGKALLKAYTQLKD